MTYSIPPSSGKHAAALAFGAELRRACRARGIPFNEVARAAGAGRTAVRNWLGGTSLPRTAAAIVIAELLWAPKLRAIVEAARTRACVHCGQPFRNDGGAPKRFCSTACRTVEANRRTAATRNRQAGQSPGDERRRHVQATRLLRSGLRIAEERAAHMAEAITEMCQQCEPDGLCRTPDCPLRPVGPHPAAGRLDPREPRTLWQIRSASWTPDRRERHRVAMLASWASGRRRAPAGFTDEQRAKAIATIRGRAVAGRSQGAHVSPTGADVGPRASMSPRVANHATEGERAPGWRPGGGTG